MTVTVLLADDHPMFREGLRAMLAGREAFEVVAAVGSGSEAVELVTRLRPDVAVLDLRMPDGDGVWATTHIRTEVPETRVLVLSSFEDQREVAAALAAGAHGYLLKSAHPDEIAQAVLTVASGSSVLSDHILGDITGAQPRQENHEEAQGGGVAGLPRFVATVLFSDIVDSTELADIQGDAAWNKLLDDHDATVERDITQAGGKVVKHTGDGILAVFDVPGRAVRCACVMHGSVAVFGLRIRVGLHTGEIQRRGQDIGGIAVHIAARVMAQASPGETLVSRTVVDLTAGGSLVFEPVGSVDLKGLAGKRDLYRAMVA